MTVCRSCGSSVTNNFCSNCGTPVVVSALRPCPRCNNGVAPDAGFCSYCGVALQPAAGAQPMYANQPPQYVQSPQPVQAPQQPQQNNAGKYLLGALGGAAAVIGGEILLHDVERGIEHHVERDVVRQEWAGGGPHHHHHHHHRRCFCGHEYAIDIDICPRCRRRWGSW